MTTTTSGSDWTQRLKEAAVPDKCVRIEIKPGNRDGIREGIIQLGSWSHIRNVACGQRKPMHFLIVYRLLPLPSATAKLWIAHVDSQVAAEEARNRAGVKGKRPALVPPRFKYLGELEIPEVNAFQRKRECSTQVGAILEEKIRANYDVQMKRRFGAGFAIARKSSTHTTGPDIDHEFAEFLAELASELADR